MTASQVEIEALQAEKSRREPVVKHLLAKMVEEDAKLKQLLAESQKQRTMLKQQLHDLKQGLAMYQRLGLVFEHSEGQWTVSLTAPKTRVGLTCDGAAVAAAA